MSERVFCIDFGSAYTKVALRRDPGAQAELINNPTRRAAELDFCVPSVALVDRTGKQHRAEFGPAVFGRREGNGINIYHNWKRYLFADVTTAGEIAVPPLDALLQSDPFRQLAERFGVTGAQVGHLQQLVSNARGLFGIPLGRTPNAEAGWQTFAAKLAYCFFRWLRLYILDACGHVRSAALNPEAIPVRLTVPAFSHGSGIETHPGCAALTDALSKAGWPLHPTRPVVSEPYSNVIGVLTEGANVVHNSRLQLRRMFREGPIILTLSKPEDHPTYRAWSLDVGAFTTDFAALSIDTQGKLADDHESAIRVAQHSIPLGVSELDRRVLAVLPSEQRDWLENHAQPLDWEDFRSRVYTAGRPLNTAAVGTIGAPDSRERIDAVLRDFGSELAAACTTFRAQQLPPIEHQELILTGGGNAIPAVHEALTAAMQSGGSKFVHVYIPTPGRHAGPDRARRLDEQFTRGGSALGGASIYFEKGYY